MEQETCKVSRWQLLKQELNNLEPEGFHQAVQRTPAAQLIDVRTAGEFAQNGLPGALNFDYLAEGFLERLEALNKEKPYFVYCRSGRRSVRTCTLMKNSGFQKVHNLEGGLKAWKAYFDEP
jgi:rhodanese-related sulfurtransferase